MLSVCDYPIQRKREDCPLLEVEFTPRSLVLLRRRL